MGDLAERTVYVTGLHAKVTSELLEELFVQMGPVEKVTLMDRGQFRFALVTFVHSESVPFAVEMMDGVRLFRSALQVRPKQGSQQEKLYNDQQRGRHLDVNRQANHFSTPSPGSSQFPPSPVHRMSQSEDAGRRQTRDRERYDRTPSKPYDHRVAGSYDDRRQRRIALPVEYFLPPPPPPPPPFLIETPLPPHRSSDYNRNSSSSSSHYRNRSADYGGYQSRSPRDDRNGGRRGGYNNRR